MKSRDLPTITVPYGESQAPSGKSPRLEERQPWLPMGGSSETEIIEIRKTNLECPLESTNRESQCGRRRLVGGKQ